MRDALQRDSGRGAAHLTVARHQDPSFLDHVADALTPSLPLACTMREAWLMERDAAGYWHLATAFPFGSET